MDYQFQLRGTMPLLIHADDVMAADELAEWRKHPDNKSVSVAGDDRSPPWTWQTYLYHDGENLSIPCECLMASLRYGASKIIHKGKTTFKSMSQSGLLIGSDHCEFLNNGAPIPLDKIVALRKDNFARQMEAVRDMGFNLSVKRAKIGAYKHVRIRPRFDDWQVRGTIAVNEPAITEAVLVQMFEIAGKSAGLGDWRPSAKSAGPYGTFSAEVRPVKAARKAG